MWVVGAFLPVLVVVCVVSPPHGNGWHVHIVANVALLWSPHVVWVWSLSVVTGVGCSVVTGVGLTCSGYLDLYALQVVDRQVGSQ